MPARILAFHRTIAIPSNKLGQLLHKVPTLLLALFLVTSTISPTFADEKPASGCRPNIVVILADDLGYGSLGCYGNRDVKTPHVDRLAASGMRLTDFHSNGSLCSPTRAALLTGHYQQRCVWVPDEELSPVFREQRQQNPFQRWAWGISTDELTIPALLKQAGYRTTLIGKWHLGYDVKFHPMNYGFDEFRGFLGGHVDDYTHVASHGMRELDWWQNRKIDNEPGYSTDLLTQYTADFIARHNETPFFLLLAHGAVHSPLRLRQPSQKKSPVEIYQEMIGILDESVGAVVAELRKHLLESNTLLIICSDNGPAAPQGFAATANLRGKKNSLYEGGHRVPFIASWPGTIPAGTTSAETVMSMDLLPTFAKLAGVHLPADRKIDGRDFMPVLKGEPSDVTRDLHWQSGDAWAVRRGAWKLMGQKDKPSSLVNLHNDIAEADNLLGREPARAEELMAAHTEWVQSFGATNR
jgi:arylsulfatase A-like enzyme